MTTSDVPTYAPTKEEVAQFEVRLERARIDEERVPARMVGRKRVAWSPQAGSQTHFMQCPLFEVLYHGTRGPGKTDGLLMAFAQHVGAGHREAWRGVIFRQTYPQLADIVAKSEKWFRQIFPEARFNRQRMSWEWRTGEVLLFRHMSKPQDYWNYHGHEFGFVGFEELTNWPNDECFTPMLSCCRSSVPGVPRMVRATTNPYGVGHNWVKDRYGLHGAWWKTVIQMSPRDGEGKAQRPRCAIHGHVSENKILLAADPEYPDTITAAATNEGMAKAWRDGSWDFVAGGMFDDVWDNARNQVADFYVPAGWRIDRAFDWGSSRPFSVGWYAESDGSDLQLRDGTIMGTVRGDLFRLREWYGWTGKPNQGVRMLAAEVAEGIVEREILWGWRTERGSRVKPGPADSSIYAVENGTCPAMDMDKPVRFQGRVYHPVKWRPADKRPGSRKVGWEAMRAMIRNARSRNGLPREYPGLFVVGDHNPQFLRTVLTLPRSEKDLDDVNTKAEDHIGDEVRYRVRGVGQRPRTGTTVGMY